MVDGRRDAGTTPTASWGDFYAAGGNLSAFFANLHYHEPMVREILATSPSTALEAGCGLANVSSFLAMAGVETIAVDNDPGVLAVAREATSRWAARPELVEHDIFALDQLGRSVDVVFSQGVLEHFGDDDIRRLVQQSLAVAPRFVFSVPSKHYGVRDFGNERLMTAEQWQARLAGLGRATVLPYFFARRRHTYGLRKPIMMLGVVQRTA